MHLRNESSDSAIEALSVQGMLTQAQLKALLTLSKSQKPGEDYDTHHRNLRELYENKQERQTKKELARRFPKSADRMPLETVGIVRRVAEEDASAYSTPPERWLDIDGIRPRLELPRDKDGVVRPAADDETDDPKAVARAEAFDRMITKARLHRCMREAERRLMVAQTQFVRLGWRQAVEGRAGIGNDDSLMASLYWPHQVHVACHHSDPTNLYSAFCLIAESVGPDGGVWYEVWRRTYTEQNGQLVAFGQWRAEMIPQAKDDKDQRTAYPLFGDGIYPLPTLPWVVMHDGMPSGSVYLDEGRDLVRVQLNINALHSDHLYTVDLHANPKTVITSDEIKNGGGEISLGAGEALVLRTGDSASLLETTISDAPMATVAQRMRALAVERRQPAHRYDPTSSTVLSGIARKVEDIPATEAREERIEGYKDIEEECLLPLCVEIRDYWSKDGVSIAYQGREDEHGPGKLDKTVRYHVSFAVPSEYESSDTKERYASAMLDRGAISPARYAVMAGAYRSIDEAVEQGLSDELPEEQAPSGGGLDGFAAALNSVPVPTVVTDDDEDDNG